MQGEVKVGSTTTASSSTFNFRAKCQNGSAKERMITCAIFNAQLLLCIKSVFHSHGLLRFNFALELLLYCTLSGFSLPSKKTYLLCHARIRFTKRINSPFTVKWRSFCVYVVGHFILLHTVGLSPKRRDKNGAEILLLCIMV